MNRLRQSPHDKILWTLASLEREVNRRELRIRSKLTLAELNAILTMLEKAGKIRVVTKRTGNQTTVQLKRSPPS